MNKTYESPKADLIKVAVQDALTASDVFGTAGFNFNLLFSGWVAD